MPIMPPPVFGKFLSREFFFCSVLICNAKLIALGLVQFLSGENFSYMVLIIVLMWDNNFIKYSIVENIGYFFFTVILFLTLSASPL